MTAAASFECVCAGPAARVLLSPKAKEEFDAVLAGTDERSVRRRTRLLRYFDQFCACDPHRLKEDAYKFEESLPDGAGATVAIFEFRAHQWRLYGASLTVNGQKCFVGVLVDPNKKQDKANQRMLRAAALKIAELDEYKQATNKNTKQVSGGKHDRRKRR